MMHCVISSYMIYWRELTKECLHMSIHTTVPETPDELMEFRQWFFKKTMQIERDQRTLEDDKRRLQLQQDRLERERKDFCREKEANAKFRAQEEYVFRMKQQILEDELQKLAKEKKQMQRQKEFYDRVRCFQQKQEPVVRQEVSVVKGEMFFIGVQSEIALKKRYKDLIKIYHPDNMCGDTQTLQEINREYDRLRLAFAAC